MKKATVVMLSAVFALTSCVSQKGTQKTNDEKNNSYGKNQNQAEPLPSVKPSPLEAYVKYLQVSKDSADADKDSSIAGTIKAYPYYAKYVRIYNDSVAPFLQKEREYQNQQNSFNTANDSDNNENNDGEKEYVKTVVRTYTNCEPVVGCCGDYYARSGVIFDPYIPYVVAPTYMMAYPSYGFGYSAGIGLGIGGVSMYAGFNTMQSGPYNPEYVDNYYSSGGSYTAGYGNYNTGSAYGAGYGLNNDNQSNYWIEKSMTNNGGKTFAYAPRKSVQNFSKSEFNATYKSLARNSNMNQQKSATTTYRKNYQQLKERAVDVRPRLQGQNNNSQKLNLSYQNKRSNSLNQNNRREQTKPRQEKPRQGNVSHNETRNVQQKRNEQPRNNVQQRQQYVQHQQRTNNNSPRQITSVLRMGGGQMRMSGSVPSGGGFRRR